MYTLMDDSTAQHILSVALDLFLTQGIKRVTMTDIAQEAGVTRVTVYRHFANKETLVATVFMSIAAAFQKARTRVEADPDARVEVIVDIIGQELATLPLGDFPSRLDELRRLYPTVYEQFRTSRLEALEVIFERLFTQAKGRLRPGLDHAVVQAFFMETVASVVESPRLLALGLAPHTIFQTVKSIFLHGILEGD